MLLKVPLGVVLDMFELGGYGPELIPVVFPHLC